MVEKSFRLVTVTHLMIPSVYLFFCITGYMFQFLYHLIHFLYIISTTFSFSFILRCAIFINRDIRTYYNSELTHQQMAELIGCSRVQVTRVLNNPNFYNSEKDH